MRAHLRAVHAMLRGGTHRGSSLPPSIATPGTEPVACAHALQSAFVRERDYNSWPHRAQADSAARPHAKSSMDSARAHATAAAVRARARPRSLGRSAAYSTRGARICTPHGQVSCFSPAFRRPPAHTFCQYPPILIARYRDPERCCGAASQIRRPLRLPSLQSACNLMSKRRRVEPGTKRAGII